MEYFKLPCVEKPVSRFIFGTAIRTMMKNEDADELLDAVLAAGINTFDTAHEYGGSEESLGRWLKKGNNREKVNILTKGCHHSKDRNRVTPTDMLADFSDSLNRMEIDYVDIYLLHRDDPQVEVGPIIETLNDLQSKGKIGCFGGSNWTHQRIEMANEYAYSHNLNGFSVSSPCFSLAEQIGDPWGGSVHISGTSGKEARAWYKKNEMPVFAYSSLARGFLSGKIKTHDAQGFLDAFGMFGDKIAKEYNYPENMERLKRAEKLAEEKNLTVAQVALAWILHHPMFVCPILSPSSLKHLAANIKAFEVSLTKEEFYWLNLGEE